ncbi:site-specific integrase [Actinoplanes sp. NPDC049118]|uniref:tyrosine-type recombinase/integrase n=1 Tax=Actinoplanes sp. NPDC049118 TaxID=3155769 RepID=UPI0033D83CCB
MGRRPNGASTTYKGSDGDWHGRVTVGVKDNGKPDRRHVQSKSEAEVIRRVRALEKERDSGTVRKPGQRWTVEKWLTHWVENIAAPAVRDNTIAGYRVAVNKHLIPGVGGHRLDRLEPEHLEKLYGRMQANGSAPATAHQAHRTIRTALNEAMRRGHLVRNPASLAKAPRLGEDEVEPYSVDEVKHLLDEALTRRNSARWAVALSLGLRQSEALGLKWSDLDLDKGTLTVRRGRQRPRWRHGCHDTCGKKFGGHCPDRVPLRKEAAETKSRAGRRTIGLPDALVALLRKHQVEQAAERLTAAQLWKEGGWLFTTPTGEPVNPRTDYTDWKRLLVRAGLRDGRLHDARHTAATVLLLLGVPERAVIGIMGWSNGSMAMRYQHLTAQVRDDIAKRVDGLLWAVDDAQGDDDDGTSGALVRA